MPLRLPSSLRSESTIRKRSGSSLPDPWATSDYSKPLPPTPDLSPIPLTPRPEASRQDSEASIATRISQIPRLPTPNFLYDPGLDIDLTKYYGANRTKNLSRRFTVRSTLSRGISYISVALRPTTGNRPTPLPSRPISTGIRTESDTTLCSTRSILSSLSTAEKFTKKWPKPQPLKKLEKKSGLSIPGTTMRKAVLLALEDGQGLGMDRVQQWTNFKWCLVVSIFILFCYGTFALGWVVSTWFRGEALHSLSSHKKLTNVSLGLRRCDVRRRLRHPRSHDTLCLDHHFHLPSRLDRYIPQLSTNLGNLRSSPLAGPGLDPSSWIYKLQTCFVIFGPQTKLFLESILHPLWQTFDSKFARMLWILHSLA